MAVRLEAVRYIYFHPLQPVHPGSSILSLSSDNSNHRTGLSLWYQRYCKDRWSLFPAFPRFPLTWSFLFLQEIIRYHEVRFSSSFAGLASPPSQTARTPLDVYGFPLIIFTVLRMNQFMTFRAYHKSFPSPFAHKEYPLRIAL